MKKEYINPEMEVVLLQSNNAILAGSDPIDTVDSSTTVTPGEEDAARFFDNGGSEDW